MKSFLLNKKILIVIAFLIFVLAFFIFLKFQKKDVPKNIVQNKTESIINTHSVIGKSVEGRSIDAYSYGKGKTHVVFIGGIHGGYEWNSVVLAYKFMDYFEKNPEIIPENLTITVIPSANPDGVYKIIGKEGRFVASDVPKSSTIPGRFNANKVDLNRNFDCKWKTKSTWLQNVVSGGKAPFSEPESLAIRDYVLKNNPISVIFWHSQSGSVYSSKCENGILPETLNIMNIYSKASGYLAIANFDAYETSGDAEGWLASIDIPSITVELKTHETVEWEENLAGVKALIEYYTLKK